MTPELACGTFEAPFSVRGRGVRIQDNTTLAGTGSCRRWSRVTCTSRDRDEMGVGCVEPKELINPVHPLSGFRSRIFNA